MKEDAHEKETEYGALAFRLNLHMQGHHFELERKDNLTDHAYWLLGILIALFGAIAYAWSKRISNCLFLGLFSIAIFAWVVSLIQVIIVALPLKYKATALTRKWDQHFTSLTDFFEGAEAENEFCLDLIKDYMNMEEINYRRNEFRQKLLFSSNITTLTCFVVISALIIAPHIVEYIIEIIKLR